MVVETSYDESFLKMAMDKLECFQEANITDPEDAYIKENGTSYELVPEVEGNRLNKDKVLTLLSEAASQGSRAWIWRRETAMRSRPSPPRMKTLWPAITRW